MSNVRAGDMALITHPDMVGHPVSVLHAAPIGRRYRLPDGQWALVEMRANAWVCESLGSKFHALVSHADGSTSLRLTQFATIGDQWLRPIRDPGDDAKDEMLRPLPQKVTA